MNTLIKNNPDSSNASDNSNPSYQTQAVFQALVNVIIPRSTKLAYEYGVIQYYGALDSHTDEYLIVSLNHFNIPLAQPTADMLNLTANFLFPVTPFHPLDVLNLLKELQIDLTLLPQPFNNNPPLIISTAALLLSLTMMGYYSEWSGYGTTRLQPPDLRTLEYYPISWQQVGYPGPSAGYRAQRVYQF